MNAMEANIRNFKDFVLIYNSMSEKCFQACVVDLSSRGLENCESKCLEHCAEKHVKLNHKIMPLYVEIQQAINIKKIKAAEKNSIPENTPEEKETVTEIDPEINVELK